MCRAEKAWDWWYTELQKKIIITFSEYWTSWAGKSRLYDLDIYIEQVKHILKSTGVCRIDKQMTRWRSEDYKLCGKKTCNSKWQPQRRKRQHEHCMWPPGAWTQACHLWHMDQPVDACLWYRIWFLLGSLDKRLSCCWPLPFCSNRNSKFTTQMIQ